MDHRQWWKDNQAVKRLEVSEFETDGDWEVSINAFLLLPP
jgi:hypothetical protein